MNIKILFAVLLLPLCVKAQSDKDVIKAMQDELKRNMEHLSLAEVKPISFMSYTINKYRSYRIEASNGSVVTKDVTPWSAISSARVLIGDDKMNSDVFYNNRNTKNIINSEGDYHDIRRTLWLNTDIDYKIAMRHYVYKENHLKTNPPAEDFRNLPDMSEIEVLPAVYEAVSNKDLDVKAWEERLEILSAEFNKYKDIFNTRVGMSLSQFNFYKTTSEGTVMVTPKTIAVLYFNATIHGSKESVMNDNKEFYALEADKLPDTEFLKKYINDFAQNMINISKSQPIDEEFNGPVLFEGEACTSQFIFGLNADVRTVRPAVHKGGVMLEKEIGKKFVDEKLTVKNYTDKKQYQGKYLCGYYTVDAEGVKPQSELTLVEDGILKTMLNGRVPTPKCPKSTGSSRYYLSYGTSYATAPATLHVSSNKTVKAEYMKRKYIKLLKKRKLKFGYIVRKANYNGSTVFKIDLKGNETQVVAPRLNLHRAPLKELFYISDKEVVEHFMNAVGSMSSIICPSAIVIDNYNIKKTNLQSIEKPALMNPFKR